MSVFANRRAPRTAVQYMSLADHANETDIFGMEPVRELRYPVVFLDNSGQPISGFYEWADLEKFYRDKASVMVPTTGTEVRDPKQIDSVQWVDHPNNVDHTKTDFMLARFRSENWTRVPTARTEDCSWRWNAPSPPSVNRTVITDADRASWRRIFGEEPPINRDVIIDGEHGTMV